MKGFFQFRRMVVLPVLGFLIAWQVIPHPAGAVTIRQVVTESGIVAWFVRDTSVPLVSIAFTFRGGGSSADPAGSEGLAVMTAALMDEGAGNLDSQAFQRSLEDISAQLIFQAGRDDFSGSLQTLSAERERAFALLKLALDSPRFDEQAVVRVRQQLVASLRRSAEIPRRIAGRVWNRTVFPDHRYSRPPRGTEQSVSGIDTEDLHRFVRSRLGRDRLLIGVVGDITADELSGHLDEVFGSLPASTRPVQIPAVTLSGAGQTVVIRKPDPQSIIIFGHEAIGRDDPDWYAASLLNQILGGGGLSSRLNEEVREKRGLAYSIYTSLRPYDHASLIAGYVGTRNDTAAKTMAIIRSEWSRISEGITESELEAAKTYMIGSFPLRFGSGRSIANLLVGIQSANLGIEYLDNRPGYIRALTLDHVNRVARTFFDPDRLTVVVVGDPAGWDEAP